MIFLSIFFSWPKKNVGSDFFFLEQILFGKIHIFALLPDICFLGQEEKIAQQKISKTIPTKNSSFFVSFPKNQ